jgi:hypothetical protein
MHAFDRVVALRAAAYTALVLALSLGVIIVTDEPFSTWRMRTARLTAFVPALAALGSGAALAQARARGELRALAALGATPFRLGLGAMVSGWLTGGLAVALLASPWADVAALFPAVSATSEWRAEGAFLVDVGHGIVAAENGWLEFLPVHEAKALLKGPGVVEAELAVLPLAMVAPVWIAAPMTLLTRAFGAALTVALAVALLHGVAAQRIAEPWLVAAAAPLALQALVGHLQGRLA